MIRGCRWLDAIERGVERACRVFGYDGRLVENTCGGELVRHGTGLMNYGAVRQELAVESLGRLKKVTPR